MNLCIRMKIKVLLLLLCLFAVVGGYAQPGKLFSADQELSNSLIYSIYQDKKGIIWIATEDGLNRYDGSKYTIYKHDKKNPYSLGHNFVRILFEDSKGHFFVGLFKGLQLYDYATDTFSEISMVYEKGDTVRSHVTAILERKNGDVLIATSGEGIYRMARNENNTLYARSESWMVPSLHIISIYEDKEENLWISTEDKGLYLFTKNNHLISFFRHNHIALHNISAICEDNEGNLLVGSMTQGLFGFNKDAMSFFPIVYAENPALPIKTLYTDGSGNVYIGTDGCGIKVYKSNGKKITNSDFDVAFFDFDKSKVHAIREDEAGNMWIGIYQRGVALIPEQVNKFNYTGYKSVKNNTIGSNTIVSLCEDSEGILWVGTDNDGLYGIYPNGKQYAHFAHSEKKNSVPATILCIYEDSNHDLWVGSYLNGMGKVNRKTGECTYVAGILDENQNPVPRIYSIVEDSDKQLWIGTMGAGLYSMDMQTKKVTNHNRADRWSDSAGDDCLVNNWIDCLLLSSDNKLYIGTYNGLACLDLNTRSYLSVFEAQSLLPGLVIYVLHEDKQGNIWAGTAEGLVRIGKDTRHITTYTTEDGLPGNVICAIKEDDEGCLWLSTYYGISKFNTEKNTCINYYVNDGLQGNEFSKGAACVNARGQILFGGINGITHFYPQHIGSRQKQLKIRITDFYIHDQPVRKGTKSGRYTIIDSSVMDAEVFRLAHGDNSFSVEFSVMDFTSPERITYMYSVSGDDWVTLRPGINRISFSNLPPGKYDFKVRGKEAGALSNERNISVIINPPWYLTAWAKLIYFFISIGLIFFAILEIRQRYRSRQKMIEHQHAEEINEAKLQFFMNIAHEIRTPMSLVISPLKRLIASDADEGRQKNYRTIHRNAERILSLINQLMDIRKIDKGIMGLKFSEVEIVGFVEDIYSCFEYPAKAKNIEFTFRPEIKELNVWVDPKNFDKIILNILSNAFKFTPQNGKIDICLHKVEEETENDGIKSFFEIIISDDGIGIKEEERERIFERFYQIRNSYNNSNISAGIGLHLTRSLVELHHGAIWVENREGEGTCFIIRIPLGKEHLSSEEIEDNPDLLQAKAYQPEIIPEYTEGEGSPPIRSKTKYRVMVVEDDEEIREYICRELAGEYHTIGCTNGKEALNFILSKAPDLIISDVMMPEMDGITLCRKIRQNININHLPIILVTAKSKEEDTLEGLNIGADVYIVKPFNIEILKKTVENLIRNRDILRNTFKGNQQQEDKVRKIQIKSADEKLMERVMKVINDNISNPELSVEMIAGRVGISRVHLHRKLKELTNQTTRDFIRNIRLKQAASLLIDKNLTVTEVAEATGFSNLAYFSSAFKDLYGVSPSVYDAQQEK